MKNDVENASKVFIIVGDYLNGCTLDKTISTLFPSAKIHVVSTSGRNMLPRLRHRKFTEFNSKTDDAIESLEKVLSQYSRNAVKYLLLTSEVWHEALWHNRSWLKENNVVVHLGNRAPNEITQKKTFAAVVGKQLGYSVPLEFDLESLDNITFPVMVKSSSSYSNGERQVNKFIAQDILELREHIAGIPKREQRKLIVQQLLDTSPENCISVSGWFDSELSILLQTTKLIQYPEKMGNGVIVRAMDLDPNLKEMTNRICEAFDYHGPFELEFIRHQGKYFVLEMNPRFWMQHGLIEARTGGRLLLTYCGLPDSNRTEFGVEYWCNPIQCLYRLLKLDFRPFCVLKGNSYSPLTFWETVRWIFIHYVRLPI